MTAPRDVDVRLEGPDNGFQRVTRPRAAKPETKWVAGRWTHPLALNKFNALTSIVLPKP